MERITLDEVIPGQYRLSSLPMTEKTVVYNGRCLSYLFLSEQFPASKGDYEFILKDIHKRFPFVLQKRFGYSKDLIAYMANHNNFKIGVSKKKPLVKAPEGLTREQTIDWWTNKLPSKYDYVFPRYNKFTQKSIIEVHCKEHGYIDSKSIEFLLKQKGLECKACLKGKIDLTPYLDAKGNLIKNKKMSRDVKVAYFLSKLPTNFDYIFPDTEINNNVKIEYTCKKHSDTSGSKTIRVILRSGIKCKKCAEAPKKKKRLKKSLNIKIETKKTEFFDHVLQEALDFNAEIPEPTERPSLERIKAHSATLQEVLANPEPHNISKPNIPRVLREEEKEIIRLYLDGSKVEFCYDDEQHEYQTEVLPITVNNMEDWAYFRDWLNLTHDKQELIEYLPEIGAMDLVEFIGEDDDETAETSEYQQIKKRMRENND